MTDTSGRFGRPIIQLADASSVFPAWYATEWRLHGQDSCLVTSGHPHLSALPDGTPIYHGQDFEGRLYCKLSRGVLRPLVERLQGTTPWFRERFFRRTGIPRADWQPYYDQFAPHVLAARGLSRACAQLNGRCVVAHEVSTYGIAAALCSGVPRILIPWGSDVFVYPETSPYMAALVGFALKRADLVVPGSITAANHIVARFGLDPGKVIGLSRGVHIKDFPRISGDRRQVVREQFGIPPDALLVLNSRRFYPGWGCVEILDAFIQLAGMDPEYHFVLLGGTGTESYTDNALRRVVQADVRQRFTLLRGNTPLADVKRLMGIADIFVSISPKGDMRSASVLQCTAAGGVPVISDTPEWQLLRGNGMRAFLMPERSAACVVTAVRAATAERHGWEEYYRRNLSFLDTHENRAKQWDKFSALIDSVC